MTDYRSPAPQNITIPAGSATATFNITIYKDRIVERNETFCLFIAKIFSTCSSFDADPQNATVIIVDGGTYVCTLCRIYSLNYSSSKAKWFSNSKRKYLSFKIEHETYTDYQMHEAHTYVFQAKDSGDVIFTLCSL